MSEVIEFPIISNAASLSKYQAEGVLPELQVKTISVNTGHDQIHRIADLMMSALGKWIKETGWNVAPGQVVYHLAPIHILALNVAMSDPYNQAAHYLTALEPSQLIVDLSLKSNQCYISVSPTAHKNLYQQYLVYMASDGADIVYTGDWNVGHPGQQKARQKKINTSRASSIKDSE